MRARADNFYSPAPLGLHEDKVFSPGAVDDPQSPRSAFADPTEESDSGGKLESFLKFLIGKGFVDNEDD